MVGLAGDEQEGARRDEREEVLVPERERLLLARDPDPPRDVIRAQLSEIFSIGIHRREYLSGGPESGAWAWGGREEGRAPSPSRGCAAHPAARHTRRRGRRRGTTGRGPYC